MMKNLKPNYKKIYRDILQIHFPHKEELCVHILTKPKLSVQDIINLNNIIFESKDKDTNTINQKFKSYSEDDILYILDYQKKNNLNNSQLAAHFQMSRNTVSKWRKNFINRV